jgi:Ca-activated chloride channel family protein
MKMGIKKSLTKFNLLRRIYLIKRKYIIFILFLLLLKVSMIYSDGMIVVDPPISIPNSNPFLLEVKYHHVDVDINEQIAITNIDQVFYNPTKNQLQGYYIFPIPQNAVIKKFSMNINGKETNAELLDSDKARKIYEDIVRKHLDPALLEYIGNGLYKVRIFPIEPYSEKRVKISYSEMLTKDNGSIEYLYPLNTEKFSSKPLKSVHVNVNIKTKNEIKNVYCTSHNTDIVYKNKNNILVSYEEENVKPERDFVLYFNNTKDKIGISVLTYKEKDENGFFYLDINPGFQGLNNPIIEKDVTFILDTSGSMKGDKLKQAKKALTFCIENLSSNDQFEIIRFSTEAECFFNQLKKANKENIKQAKEFIKSFEPIGGTNIEEAIKKALSEKNNKNRPHFIIFITDGKPTIGQTEENKLLEIIKKNNSDKLRIFTFGIGYEINTHLLDKITQETHSFRSYISPSEDIERKISNFFIKIQYPVLTDISLKTKGDVRFLKFYPQEIPDLFKGSSINIIGRYKGDGDINLILKGMINDKQQSYTYKINFPKENLNNESISTLWASRRVGYLLDQIRLTGEKKEIIEEITILAKTYGIITPYTSYLIVEDEIEQVRRGELEYKDQVINRMMDNDKILEQNKKEYHDIKNKEGMGSVRSSEEIQSLNKASNYQETLQGNSRLGITDDKGYQKNITSIVKNIQGRSFYQTQNIWIDIKIQETKSKNKDTIKFASKKYFELLKKYPKLAQILALGKNIKFVFNNKIYEIVE